MLIDSHAHIDEEKYDEDREEVLANAKNAGVNLIINPASDEASSRRAVALSEKYAMVYATVGFHPHDAKSYDFQQHRRMLKDWAKKDKVVAIGEIGLDYFKSEASPEVQKKRFIQMISLALKYNLPAIVHSRSAFDDTLESVSATESTSWVVSWISFDCFSAASSS